MKIHRDHSFPVRPEHPKGELPKAEFAKPEPQKADAKRSKDDKIGPELKKAAEKEMLKAGPELKGRLRDIRPNEVGGNARPRTERDKVDDKLERQTRANSVFGKDRVTLSPEAQVVPGITRKSEAVGVKKQRMKFLPPNLNKLAARANPAGPPAGVARVAEGRPAFEEFLGAFAANFA